MSPVDALMQRAENVVLVSYMYNFDSVQITVVLNVQNFGKCLSFNVSSVAGFD
jgi:hypothetical protein